MKLIKILAATTALTVVLAAPAMATTINIAPAQLSGSVVRIQSSMIRTQGATAPTTQGSSVVSIPAQGSSEISLKGLIHSQPVAVPIATANPDEIGVVNAPMNVAAVMPQVPAATALTDSEQQMVDEINQARAAAGVAPVKVDLRLVTAARIKAEDLYQNHYFSHVSPNFGYTASLLPGLGMNVNYWSENVAGNSSVDGAMAALMESIGHRVNILDPNVDYVGVAALEGISPYNLYVQEFAHE
jgi:uncharacterized protein YkwD